MLASPVPYRTVDVAVSASYIFASQTVRDVGRLRAQLGNATVTSTTVHVAPSPSLSTSLRFVGLR